MSDEHRALGLEAAQKSGLPSAPGQLTAMEAYARKREQKGMQRGAR